MSKPAYKLSCILMSHSGDVRGLAVFKNGNCVSVSRDKTSKLWKYTNGSYALTTTMQGHNNFVSSVCVFNPSDTHPDGLILTGGLDTNICLYKPGDVEPFKKFKAHENSVCYLRTSVAEKDVFFSCSWDMSVKMWHLTNLSKPKVAYIGHKGAALCVTDLKNGFVVSGGADNIVFVWTRDGNVLHKLPGHKDCIRDLTPINENNFLTCANDASIKCWNSLDGCLLKEFSEHENYIYSIDGIPEEGLYASAGEDQTIRIWSQNEVTQVIKLPNQSVWSIKFAPNKDVLCACNDGDIKVFTCDPERFADSETLLRFEEAVKNFQQSTEKEFGGKKLDELPDGSALLQAGMKDGEVKMIREGNSVKAYGWSQRDLKWNLIGDVLSSNANSAAKTLYNGIEYDYVFSVDIEDGVPPLKLPYNLGQDPWHVAQKFIHDNNLSQMFLEQVANFIVKNSRSNAVPIENTGSQFADPFTGGNRYIPSTAGNSNASNHLQSTVSANNVSSTTSYIPMTSYLKLEQANLVAIHDKLKEFNAKLEVDGKNVSNDKLDLIVKLASNQSQEAQNEGAITTLKYLLEWPDSFVFPVLDISRLAVLKKNVNEQFCTEDIMKNIKKHLNNTAQGPNQMLAFRLLANMFHHEKGEKLCLEHTHEILKAVFELQSTGNKNNQVAISTYILNLAVALNKRKEFQYKIEIMDVIFNLLQQVKEPEATFRILVGLGTLLDNFHKNSEKELLAYFRQSDSTLALLQEISHSTDSNYSKVISVSKQIIDLLIH